MLWSKINPYVTVNNQGEKTLFVLKRVTVDSESENHLVIY